MFSVALLLRAACLRWIAEVSYPSFAMVSSTRLRVLPFTRGYRLSTRETVDCETEAAAATSVSVTGSFLLMMKTPFGGL